MATATVSRPSKALHIALWVVQALVALAFGMAGVLKLTTPIDQLHQQMDWTLAVPDLVVRFIGLSELSGAIGMILPAATRIAPRLTPIAGIGLVLVMLLAAVFHATRGELGAIPINVVLGSLAAFVAWGRWRRAAIAPR